MKERIKAIRKTLGFTQQELADRLNIQRGSIAGYEVGRISPSNATVSLICKELNVSEEWLRNGTGEMFIPITRDEEIDSFVTNAKKGNGFKKRLISVFAKLDEKEWGLLEKIAEDILDSKKPEA